MANFAIFPNFPLTFSAGECLLTERGRTPPLSSSGGVPPCQCIQAVKPAMPRRDLMRVKISEHTNGPVSCA